MQQLTLVLGNKNYSSWSLRPWLFMRKNGLSFNEKMVWLETPTFKQVLESHGSNGKVPALLDGEIQVWDSLGIIDYLCSSRALTLTWPKDAKLLALARSMSAEMHSGFMALRNELSMDTRLKRSYQIKDPDCQKDIDRIISLWQLALRSGHREGSWLFGEFSVADAMFAPVVFRLNSNSIKVPAEVARYIEFVLRDDDVVSWVEAAREEVVLPGH
ncbi:MAG: glutathione S-transferase [Saprospiraceae bacterium]|jgi:glutathione S-transferase